MISAADRTRQAQAAAEIFDFMRKHGLALDDLTAYGGEDLKNPKHAEKARRVDKCWALMARLSVKYADLESAPPPIPDKRPRRRRGEGHFSEVIETKEVFGIDPFGTKSNEINDLANSAPIGDLESNPGTSG